MLGAARGRPCARLRFPTLRHWVIFMLRSETSRLSCRPFSQPLLALTLALVGAVAALSLAWPATAGVYKCKNAAGEVLYVDRPCPAAVSVEKLTVDTQPSVTPAPVDNNAYSVVNQARQIDRRDEYKRRNAAMEKINASHDYQTAIQRIDAALSQLNEDESGLQSQIGGQSVSSQWAEEDVASIKAQRAQLLQMRANIVARMKDAADQQMKARVERAEATANEAVAQAREADARAQDADARAQDAEARAQDAANEASRPKFNITTGQWCQTLGGAMHCY